MLVDVIQNSFAAGEIGPSLYGRTDISQYANACEIVQNFIPRSYGSAISMPGTRYVATVSDSTLNTRLIKFVFNRSDAYVIEMGDKYMRFFTSRGQVVTPGGTDDLSTYGTNVISQWKCNDNTETTTVLDAQGAHDASASTITTSLSTTAVVGDGFNLAGKYHVSVADDADFTRTASTQPMSVPIWAYYSPTGVKQVLMSKSGEYELAVDSSNKLVYGVSTDNSDTKLLLHCDGTDASQTFADSSLSSHTLTASGNAQLDTAQKKFGSASGKFDGSGDYVTVPDSADFDFGAGAFTIDFWVRFPSVPSNAGFYQQRVDANNFIALRMNGGYLEMQIRDTSTNRVNYSQAWTVTANTWYHLAFVRGGDNFYVFVNGTQKGTTLTWATGTITDYAADVTIGTAHNSGGTQRYLNGWLDEFRVVKGSAVWTSNFTVPDAPYQASVQNVWNSEDALSTGWHLIVPVFKGDGTRESDFKMYVDGSRASLDFISNSGFVRMANTAADLRFGASSSAGADIWQGMIDEISFLHQELGYDDMDILYVPTAYQLTTVFGENEVWDVQYTQLNDVIWLASENHPPQKLIRTSDAEWSIGDAPIVGGPFLDPNTPAQTSSGVSATSIAITSSGATGTVNITVSPTNANLFTVSGSTLGHHDSYWMIGGLNLTNTTTGLQENGYVRLTYVTNGYTATATVLKTVKTGSQDYWAEGAWSSVRGYPGRVIIQGNRLWFARTNYEPQKEWGSKIFDYENFALDTQAEDDGLNLALSSNESNEIQWLGAGKSLLAGTFGGVFVTNSGSNEAITPDNVTASEEIGYGGESIIPKKIGQFLYYIQRFGKKMRELFYNWELDTYKALDKTILAPHVLTSCVDMDVQNNPETIIYCVNQDGTMATMTREVDQEVTAWAKHTTDGTYTSVAIIPSQTYDYDEVWVIVERWINGNKRKYVEFFENIVVPDRQDQCCYFHSALTYDAFLNTEYAGVLMSLSATGGSGVTLTVSSAYFNLDNSFYLKKIGAMDEDGQIVGECIVTATVSTTSMTVSVTTTFDALSYNSGMWGVATSEVTGLDHLEGKYVTALGDGKWCPILTVIGSSVTNAVVPDYIIGGSLDLNDQYYIVTVGLSYDQIIKTLRKEIGSQRGTAQGKWQRYSEILFKLNRSTQDFEYGPDEDNLDNVNKAFTPTVTTLYSGILPSQGGGIAMRGGYNRGAQIYIKNSTPLPIELLNIMGALETYDK